MSLARISIQQIRQLSKRPEPLFAVSSSGSRKYSPSAAGRINLQIAAKMAPTLAPTVKLNNGYEMPVLGLGTYELKKSKCETAVRHAINMGYRHIDTAFLYRNEGLIGKVLHEKLQEGMVQRVELFLVTKSKNNEAEIAVKHAIDIGYRHIDTAYFYQNEQEIGSAIRAKIAEGVVKREDIFLVTKLWNIHHDPDRVEVACRKQLASFGLDYIDLYLMHMPVAYKYVDEETRLPKDEAGVLQLSDIDYLETYKAMEKLVQLGLVRSIGLSNFNSEQINRIVDNCEIRPVTNQVECSPALNQKKLIQFCKDHDMTLTAYSPLGRPKPAERTPGYFFSEKTKAIADKYNKTPAQVVLRFLIDLGTIPIPKSANPQRIEENFNVFDFKLTADEMATMEEFHTGERLVPFNLIKGQNHKYWPFSIEY